MTTNDQQYIEERYSFFGDLRYFEKEFVEEEIQKILSNNDLDFKAQSKDIAKIRIVNGNTPIPLSRLKCFAAIIAY